MPPRAWRLDQQRDQRMGGRAPDALAGMERAKQSRTSGVLTRRLGDREVGFGKFCFFFRQQLQQYLPPRLIGLGRQQSLVMFDVEAGYGAVQGRGSQARLLGPQ
jgi:hypothetical protein